MKNLLPSSFGKFAYSSMSNAHIDSDSSSVDFEDLVYRPVIDIRAKHVVKKRCFKPWRSLCRSIKEEVVNEDVLVKRDFLLYIIE